MASNFELMIGINLLNQLNSKKILSNENFNTIELKGLKFNPIFNKWRKSDDLSVNYIICSLKN